ncbi:hypothetical protein [Anaeromicropila populeti]|uniref:Uncharacterized protein n=1 Tax=Anaeromicropila populeti TaxID=37658 RepID=A0A1I6IEN9_9FIRM|nr:hypothetical protein [Anaeromicropila populeti]SFR64820.1 hypothetical protein SAMN05661086_00734 [Anaeromicropila populeti]
MANTATFQLNNFENGNIMFWSVFAQTGTHGTITLKDNKKEYFSVRKGTDDERIVSLAQSSAVYQGKANLCIEIDIPDRGVDIKQSINSYNMVDTNSNVIACGYNFCIGAATDKDYNDYYINIIAWKKKK